MMSRRKQVSFDAKVPTKRRISFTAKGKKVSFTATVPTKRRITFMARANPGRLLSKAKRVRIVPQTKNDWTELKTVPRRIESGLSVVADVLTLASILGIFGAFGFNVLGLVITLVYLGIWEVVGIEFSSVESRLPRPFRRLWRIAEQLISICFG